MKATKIGNKYQITYRVPNFPKLINERFDTIEEANLRIAQINYDRSQGNLLPPPELVDPEYSHDLYREPITVKQLMDEYVNLYGLKHWSEGTLSCNVHRINDYIIPYIGDIPVKTLTTHRLEKFYAQLLTLPAVKMKGRESEENTISPSVVEKVHSIIRSALNQAIRWDYLRGANPALVVELPRYKKGQRAAWDDAQARYALEMCDDRILKLCILLALGCSMRIGEILGLTWNNVHIEIERIEEDRAYLFVDKELRRCNKQALAKLREQGRDEVFFTFPELKKTKSTTSLVLKTPKTESSVRKIFLPQTVALALRAMQEHQSAIKAELGDEYIDYDLVIAQNNGRPFEEHMIAQKFNTLIRETKLPRVVFHSLRHSSTSMKLRISGGDIKSVQGDTGHAVADMVTNVYGHIMNDDRRRLARKVDEEFFSAPCAVPKTEETAPQPSMDESTQKAMKLLQNSPNMAEAFLKMAELFGGNLS